MSAAAQLTAPQLLASEGLIVVPGDLAAQQLRNLHDTKQRARGLTAWSPASVLTWGQWLRALWSEAITDGNETRLLLNPAQEQTLWREIILRRRSATDDLSSAHSLADLATSAWRLSESYSASDRLARLASTHDARTFSDWANDFARLCKTSGYVSRASLDGIVASKISAGEVHFEQPLTFAGFPSHTPAQAKVLSALAQRGVPFGEVELIAEGAHDAEPVVLCAENESDELHAVARWIRRFIETRIAVGLPARVGVLVPDLDGVGDKVNSVFRSVLAPALQSVSMVETGSPFEIAVASGLHAEPMIAAALDLARWATGPLSREAVTALLLSPYLTPEPELERAAQFDACTLRSARLLRPEVDLRWLAKELWRSNALSSIKWPQNLANFLDSGGDLDTPRSFAQWTEFIRRLLRSAGWPGEQLLTVGEMDTNRAWDDALDSVATLDFTAPRVTYAEALEALDRQVVRPSFGSAGGQALVQVLGVSDAEAMTFDALVIARATDNKWPRALATNSLIGWQLQADLGMPGTDRSAAATEARNAIAHWRKAAGQLVFSFSSTELDQPQRLSSFIAEHGFVQQSATAFLPPPGTESPIEPEVLGDASPLPSLPSPHVQGGASILQHQAACGFRAFAEIRLRAQELEAKDLGFDARDRGNLLHNIMQKFWAEVKTQRNLRSMTFDDRRKFLSECVNGYLLKHAANALGWDAAYLNLQSQRLIKLLNRWLDSELQRSDFEVLETEIKEEVSIGPLDLTVRLDRIDRVDGGVFLVDYKTGSTASAADWEGERPDEPQLPLYSLLPNADELAGLAFAKVRPGKTMGWQGYAAQGNILPGRDTSRDLASLQAEWRTHLTVLAEAFAAGDTSVQPKTYPTTCAFCAQRLLCRLDTAALLDTEDDEQTDEEQP